MGTRMMGMLAAAAPGLAAAVAWGQPEYVRIDPAVHQYAGPWIAADGDVLAWTGSPDEHKALHTQILRRTETGWQREATLRTPNRGDYGAITVVSGDRVAMRAGVTGLRIWRHERGQWVEEHLDRNDLLWGEAVAIDGPWLVMPLRRWGMWNLPLVVVYHFDGERWRLHSHLEAPTSPDQLPMWIALEDDLMAVQLTNPMTFEPAPVVVFRLDGDQWRHEQTLPVDSWWVAINEGRIAVLTGGGLTIYVESAPGVWEVDSSVPGVGRFVLDGDTLVAIEPVVPAEWDFRGRAAVFHRTDTGWERTRALYPSNAFSLETSRPHLPFALSNYAPIAWADGEVFAVTVEGEWGWFDEWHIVGFSACGADFNGDGVADIADLQAFLEGREQGLMSVDYDMDVEIGNPADWDEGDLLEFMRLLEEGC